MSEKLLKFPQLKSDFAVALAVIGSPSGSLRLMGKPSELKEAWLRIEFLLLSRLYLQIQQELDVIEKLHRNNADTWIAVIYLRAFCYWELGEKDRAVEILENLTHQFPDYRNAATVLSEWKQELA